MGDDGSVGVRRQPRVSQSFSLDEARVLLSLLGGDCDPVRARISKRIAGAVERVEKGRQRRFEHGAARARNERIIAAFNKAVEQKRAWDSRIYAEENGLSYHVVAAAVSDARLAAGLRFARIRTDEAKVAEQRVAAAYTTLRDANQWGPWQLQPLAELVRLDVVRVRRAVRAASKRYPEGPRYDGGLPALLRDLRNVEYRDRNEEAAE